MRLYVGNLAYRTTQESLQAFFEQCGPVASVHIPVDRETGRGRGFAFVEIESSETAQKAMGELNGKELDGRAIRISEAREQSDRGGRGGGGGGGGGGDRGGSRPPRRRNFGDRGDRE